MSDREDLKLRDKLIQGMQAHTQFDWCYVCSACPYEKDEGCSGKSCDAVPLLKEAREYLEKQVARPLTIEEATGILGVPRWAEYCEIVPLSGEYAPCAGWAIVKDTRGDDPLFVTFATSFGDKRRPEGNYGKTWRMWSSEPTEEQKAEWEWIYDGP